MDASADACTEENEVGTLDVAIGSTVCDESLVACSEVTVVDIMVDMEDGADDKMAVTEDSANTSPVDVAIGSIITDAADESFGS